MPQAVVLLLFSALLVFCVASGLSILYALAGGYLLFAGFAVFRGYGLKEVWEMSIEGVRTVSGILITFLFIGMLTASWRAAGTIPDIVIFVSDLIRPEFFLVLIFFANTLLSVLTGTSFGTVATMGVISMTIGASLGVSPLFTAGAVMSGIFVGDRWSPMSTSAMLVSAITHTDLRCNLKRMLVTGAPAFILASLLYLLMGFLYPGSGQVPEIRGIFASVFVSSWITVIPALIVVGLVLFRVNVRLTMGISIAAASLICFFIQHMGISDILRMLVLGYQSENATVAHLMNGGGMVSFAKGIAIVCISATYAGIFIRTRLLQGIRGLIERVAARVTIVSAVTLAAILACGVSCNQSFAVMLTHDLCTGVRPDQEKLALDIEDSAIVIAPLIPWSIAGAIPLSVLGAAPASLAFAFFLYLLPASRLVLDREKLAGT